MPWTPADAKRHKKGLSPRQARQWAAVANSALRTCLARGRSQASCEASAIRQANSAVGPPARPTSNTRRLTIQTALTVPAQHLSLNNQDYLTAPVVMVVEGVLNDGLIQASELHPETWNGAVVTVGHPADAQGQAQSARQPEVMATCSLGHVYRVQRAQGRRAGHPVTSLRGELWLNLSAAQHCGTEGQQCIEMLETQTPLEVSTAFYSDVEPTSGVFLGTPYREILRNLRADHLALLPQAVGACSWVDGCGTPRLNHSTLAYDCPCTDAPCTCHEEDLPMATATQGWRSFVHLLRDFVTRAEDLSEPPASPPDPDDEHPEEEDETEEKDDDEADVAYRAREIEAAQLRQAQGFPLHPHEQFILGAPDVYARQTGPMLRINQTDVDVREALYGCFAREMGMDVTPIFIADIDMAAQTFTYRQGERLVQRGWTIAEGVIQLADDHTDVQRTTTYTRVPDSPEGPQGMPHPETYAQEEPPMPAPDVIKRRVNALIANERTRWTDDDRHMLESQNEAFLIRLEQQPIEPRPLGKAPAIRPPPRKPLPACRCTCKKRCWRPTIPTRSARRPSLTYWSATSKTRFRGKNSKRCTPTAWKSLW